MLQAFSPTAKEHIITVLIWKGKEIVLKNICVIKEKKIVDWIEKEMELAWIVKEMFEVQQRVVN